MSDRHDIATVGIPVGHVAGIAVRVHWSTLLTALLVANLLAAAALPSAAPGRSDAAYLVAGCVGAALFLASLLAHEIMHAVVARRLGVEVSRITLWLLGGMAQIEGEPATPRAAAAIAGAGPATSLALGAGFGGLSWVADLLGASSLLTASATWLAVTNVVLGVFNLVPALPLDGGRLLQAALWHRYRDPAAATITAGGVGKRLGTGLIALGVVLLFFDGLDGLWLVLVGWFISGAAAAEVQSAKVRTTLPGLVAGDVMRPVGMAIPSWWTVGDVAERLGLEAALHDVLPVVDLDGAPIGTLSVYGWGRKPMGDSDTRVRDVVHAARQVGPSAPLHDLMSSGALLAGPVLVVDEQHRAVGAVTLADVQQTVRLVQAGWPLAGQRSASSS